MRRFCLVGLLSFSYVAVFGGADWLQFRGSQGNVSVLEDVLPATWDTKTNVAWSVPLEGRGLSSPIVVGDRIIITNSTGHTQDRLHVLCFKASSGELLWTRQFWATGRTICNPKTCVAAPTPASDGQHICVFYSSNDLACLDLEGNLLWFRGLTYDFPDASNSIGMSSSPVIVEETVVVQVENDTESFAMGLDVHTGLSRWKLDRPKYANWSSPTVWLPPDGSPPIVLLQSSEGATAVRPSTGEIVWQFGKGASTISSSSAAGGTVLVPSNGLVALATVADTSEPKVVWQDNKLRPSTASPFVYQEKVYVVSGSILKCAEAQTGKLVWQLRLKGPFSSSPVASGGRLYLFNEEGTAFVVQLGETGKIVSENKLGETILCTPAIADGALYVRSDHHLWKIATPTP